MAEPIKLPPIDRGPPFEAGRIVNVAVLAGREAPRRQWLVPNLIPRGTVVLFTGNGGDGKSLLMQQLLTATAIGGEWLGFDIPQGPSFGLFAEDDDDELWRRQIDINSE